MHADLQKLLDHLVPALQPEQVYLFGSHARGTASESSDWDVFVIVPDATPGAKLDRQYTASLAHQAWVPADVVACRASTFARNRDAPGSLSYVVAREGKQIYERAS